jgi:AcrR family transcriptional regulator
VRVRGRRENSSAKHDRSVLRDHRLLEIVPRSTLVAMPPRRPRTSPRRAPRQRRAEATVDVLLEATSRVLAKHGYAATTTNHIAEAAGVSIGTLYHYFPSKEALIEAIVHRLWASELEALRTRADVLENRPLAEAIDVIVVALVDVVRSRTALYGRWFAEASHLGKLDEALGMANAAIAMVRDALERRRDEVVPDDLAFAADFTVKLALAGVHTATRDYPEQLASGQFARELSAMLRRYLLREAS